MGEWGTGPYDNDAAADWFYEVNAILIPFIDKELNNGGFEEARAAAWLLGQVAVSPYTSPQNAVRDRLFDLAIDKLTEFRSDVSSEEWDHVLTEQIEHLKRVKAYENSEPTQR